MAEKRPGAIAAPPENTPKPGAPNPTQEQQAQTQALTPEQKLENVRLTGNAAGTVTNTVASPAWNINDEKVLREQLSRYIRDVRESNDAAGSGPFSRAVVGGLTRAGNAIGNLFMGDATSLDRTNPDFMAATENYEAATNNMLKGMSHQQLLDLWMKVDAGAFSEMGHQLQETGAKTPAEKYVLDHYAASVSYENGDTAETRQARRDAVQWTGNQPGGTGGTGAGAGAGAGGLSTGASSTLDSLVTRPSGEDVQYGPEDQGRTAFAAEQRAVDELNNRQLLKPGGGSVGMIGAGQQMATNEAGRIYKPDEMKSEGARANAQQRQLEADIARFHQLAKAQARYQTELGLETKMRTWLQDFRTRMAVIPYITEEDDYMIRMFKAWAAGGPQTSALEVAIAKFATETMPYLLNLIDKINPDVASGTGAGKVI